MTYPSFSAQEPGEPYDGAPRNAPLPLTCLHVLCPRLLHGVQLLGEGELLPSSPLGLQHGAHSAPLTVARPQQRHEGQVEVRPRVATLQVRSLDQVGVKAADDELARVGGLVGSVL
jgi:hypothetical protein